MCALTYNFPMVKQKKPDLSSKAYNYILDLIIKNKLQPSALIDPKELAANLGMSTFPINKALQVLAQEGFIEIIPRKGSFVKSHTTNMILDQILIREAIECQAARIYCGKSIIDNEEKLLTLATFIDNTPESEELWKADLELHTILVDLTKSINLRKAFDQYLKLTFFLRTNYFYVDSMTQHNHVKLISSLKTNDPAIAEQVIRDHLHKGKPAMFNDIEIIDGKTWGQI